jgi:uncharacterized membrane protein YidH (DUF202 family)
MRFFELSNFQDIILYLIPTLIFMLVFWLALAYSHFYTKGWQERKKKIFYRYPEEIEDKNAPFPLVMTLIVAGTVIWAFFYILMYGMLEVKI